MPSQNHSPTDAATRLVIVPGEKKKKEEESITLGVAAAPPSLQRFFINKRCPVAVKGIGHMALFTIPLQLSAPSTTNEWRKKWFSLFLSVHLYLRIIQSFLCSFALIYSSSSPRVAIKERKVTGFVTSEFSWNAQWASNTGRILQHGVPGDHLKPMAFIRKSQALSGWCKVLPGALTWWRPEEDGGEPDFARINAPNDGASGIYYSVVPGWKVQLKGEINVL